jgi:bifunctional non-homologous end joining protein LigD
MGKKKTRTVNLGATLGTKSRNRRSIGPAKGKASSRPYSVGVSTVRTAKSSKASVPAGVNEAELSVAGETVKLTNLQKIFWPKLGLTKRDLLQYYLSVSRWLLPHVQDRAMVMKRYPNGISGEFFFMKRAPESRPAYIPICSIEHHSGNVIDFPMVQTVGSLLWVINLGCIDLNPWYARCDDVERPDYLHFDLDPVPGASFEKVLETALIVRDALASIKIKSYPKTTGSRGIHVYVPILRGPLQKQVWAFAKTFAIELANRNRKLITAEYRVARRPSSHVLVDYNQNAWNRTLASVYSVRPKPAATVSTPVTWDEVERGIKMEDFTIKNVPARLAKLGDIWKQLLSQKGRTNLDRFL